MPPLATIIVVTHNSACWLARMSAAVSAQTDTRWRLVIVDSGSEHDQRPHLADLPPGASLIQSETNQGFAAANNLAAADADTPYLVFLNPDAFPEPTWLATLLATAERYPRAAAIGSTQLRADQPSVYDGTGDVMHATGLAYRSNYGKRPPAPPPLGESFSACAAAVLVRREAFEAVGGFDARYFCYFEDVDLCFRLRLQGGSILQSPDAIVAHVGGGVAGAHSSFGDFHGARNRLWTFVKCMPPFLFWLMMPFHIVATALANTSTLLRGRGFAAWRGSFAALAELSPILSSRRDIQANRKARTGAIAAALAWSPLVMIGRRPVIRPLR